MTSMDTTQADRPLEDLLERYGRALATGDTTRIADAYVVPALVLGGDASIAIEAEGEVRHIQVVIALPT